MHPDSRGLSRWPRLGSPPRSLRLGLAIGVLSTALAASTAEARPPETAGPETAGPRSSLAGTAIPEIPLSDLAEMEPRVRRQLREARERLDRLLAAARGQQAPGASPVDAATLAAALGGLGQLYQAYDLTEPAEACYLGATDLAPDDSRWRYYLGVLRQLQGRPEEAIGHLHETLRLAPDNAAARMRLADLLRAAGEPGRAEDLYRELAEEPEIAAAALAGLGRIATDRGDHAAAVAAFAAALERQPEASRLRYLLAMAYRRLGDLEGARRELARQGAAEATFPDPLMAELRALASGAAASLQRGYHAAQAGYLEAAIREYRQAVAADPSNPEARRSLAGALIESGDPAAAVEQLRELLRIDPNPAGAHFTLAETLDQLGAADEALEHYQEAVALAPRFRNFRRALARALIRARRGAEALPHLRRLIADDPQDMAARIDLAELLAASADGEAAREQFRAVLDGDSRPPQRVAAHRGLARLLAREGALDAALERLDSAVRLAPEDPLTRVTLGHLLGQAGRFDEAAAAYRRALEIEPGNEQARLAEATALVLGKRPAEAVRRLEEAVVLLPDSLDLADTLARLLAAAPTAELRDGPRAVVLAEGLLERQPSLRHGETLAMALAEAGRLAEAVEWQERIVVEAERLGDAALLARAREVLAIYRRGEPYRLPY